MILSGMVGQSSEAEAKKYKITFGNFITWIQDTYAAGELVGIGSTEKTTINGALIIGTTASGKQIPGYGPTKLDGVAYPSSGRSFYAFVMPSDNVTINEI